MKCIYCGAEISSSDGRNYECPYCGSSFIDQNSKVAPAPVESKPESSKTTSYQGANVFEDNINGVLEITWKHPLGFLVSGSGLLIDYNGYALTNAHVVCNEMGAAVKSFNALIAGKKTQGTVISLGDNEAGRGNGVDLALIKIGSLPAGAKALTFADFNEVRIGEQVFVIGNSLGDGTCITAGIVSDKQRKVNGHTVMMTDCAINGGNSGGPIFNSKGEVIGVICSKRLKADGSATEGMNYAIPINIAKDFISGKVKAIKLPTDGGRQKYEAAKNKR